MEKSLENAKINQINFSFSLAKYEQKQLSVQLLLRQVFGELPAPVCRLAD